MEKRDIEELREKVSCAAILETDGWQVDLKESTRRAVKYRRGEGEIVIVIHEGRGWFDPLSDAKGDVLSLAEHLGADGFAEALMRVREIVGFVPTEPQWTRQARESQFDVSIAGRWQARRRPWRGSASWRYLRDTRHIPESIIRTAIGRNLLREGPHGSMWAAHTDDEGNVTGWEERGPDWRGFASGGTKELFRMGAVAKPRICVCEAAIDAMSLAAIENELDETLYVSTGGGWSPATEMAIRKLAARPGVVLVAATDNNAQGEAFAARILAIAGEADCGFERLTPRTDDWNEDLSRGKAGRESDQGK